MDKQELKQIKRDGVILGDVIDVLGCIIVSKLQAINEIKDHIDEQRWWEWCRPLNQHRFDRTIMFMEAVGFISFTDDLVNISDKGSKFFTDVVNDKPIDQWGD